MTQGKFKIVLNQKVGPDYFRMRIFAPEIVRCARPGQFVHLRCQGPNSIRPLLRRPLSFHRIHRHNFEVLYKLIGQGTNLLAKKGKNDTIDALGPLGNGFNIRNTECGMRNAILVAGGMGVAPLLALAEKIAKKSNLLVLIGARTKSTVLCRADFENLGAKVLVATNNGTLGHKGLVTDLLKKLLRNTEYGIRNTIYACGPKPMLKAVAHIAFGLRIRSYASLEEHMACGLGACLGCAVETKFGYQRVCKDGPVFELQEIKW